MLVKSFLIRFVVIRRNRKNSLKCGKIGFFDLFFYFHGVVSANTQNKRNAFIINLYDVVDNLIFFFCRKCCRLCGSSQNHKIVGSVFDVVIYQFGK